MAACALSSFFKDGANRARFKNVEGFVGDWHNPDAVSELRRFCGTVDAVKFALRDIVPERIHESTGLTGDRWIDHVAGPDSRLAEVEAEVCADYRAMQETKDSLISEQPKGWTAKVGHIERRMKTIAEEQTLSFLSRKAYPEVWNSGRRGGARYPERPGARCSPSGATEGPVDGLFRGLCFPFGSRRTVGCSRHRPERHHRRSRRDGDRGIDYRVDSAV